MFASLLVQMNSTILLLFHYSHYDCMAACISWGKNKYSVHCLFLIYFWLQVFFPTLEYSLALDSGGCSSELCYQLDNIAFLRLWGSNAPTVPASLIHSVPWTVVIKSNPPLDAQIQATASSQYLLLDLPEFYSP
jgi:hypothetical protein